MRSRSEAPRTYDLFQAINAGATEEDPYVRPGDSVRVLPVGPLVTVRGEVNEPGRYEVLPGETLLDVIQYAGGFAPDADRTAVRLARVRSGRTSTESYNLTEPEDVGPVLRDGDQITVDTSLRGRPLVFIEGALQAEEEAPAEGVQTIELVEEDVADVEAGYIRIAEFYHEGLMLSDVLTQLRDRIAAFADLQRTTVVRAQDEALVEVNGSQLLYGYGDAEDVRLQPFDTIFIPSRQISILITGPVAEPGLYLYVPGQPPEYYIRRAGGFNPEISTSGEYIVYDSSGAERSESSEVRPGDHIRVERNNFVYQFNRHVPLIVSSLSLITTVITVFATINQ